MNYSRGFLLEILGLLCGALIGLFQGLGNTAGGDFLGLAQYIYIYGITVFLWSVTLHIIIYLHNLLFGSTEQYITRAISVGFYFGLFFAITGALGSATCQWNPIEGSIIPEGLCRNGVIITFFYSPSLIVFFSTPLILLFGFDFVLPIVTALGGLIVGSLYSRIKKLPPSTSNFSFTGGILGLLFSLIIFLLNIPPAVHGNANSIWGAIVSIFAIALLWLGYFILVKKEMKLKILLFSLLFILLFIGTQIIAPESLAKNTLARAQRSRILSRVQVKDFHNEVVLSALGNPVAIKLEYIMRFPRDGIYNIHPSFDLKTANNQRPKYPCTFFNLSIDKHDKISPAPTNGDVFKTGVDYQFTDIVWPTGIRNQDNNLCIYSNNLGQLQSYCSQWATNQIPRFNVRIYVSTGSDDQPFENYTESAIVDIDVKNLLENIIKEGAPQCKLQ